MATFAGIPPEIVSIIDLSRRKDLMLGRIASLALVTLAGAALVSARPRNSVAADLDLIVHEWGTFTTVAGQDGRAIDWLPLDGPTDLPCFVAHFQNRNDVKIAPNQLGNLLDYATAKANLWGKVRMETPVLYFYSPRKTTLSVDVRFPHGLMTEWYPRAMVAQPFLNTGSLGRPNFSSEIAWSNVIASPGPASGFPSGEGASHYYAARNTDATPLNVNGQRERFLFYRGVGSFDVPVTASALGTGAIRIRNTGSEPLRGVVLFENRGGVVRYRVVGALASSIDVTSVAGSATDLHRELERQLVSAGLYAREAAAMVDTWRDSWFEEGTRVFYLLPASAINAILPLSVNPTPSTTARVFVGRMEVITPDIERSVETAIVRHDTLTLERYGRFLSPIADRLLAKSPSQVEQQTIRATTTRVFAAFVKRASSCE